MFEKMYEEFLEDQRRGATGQRREMLYKDLTGIKRLLEVILWPVLKSFGGLILEYEVDGYMPISLHPIHLGRVG